MGVVSTRRPAEDLIEKLTLCAKRNTNGEVTYAKYFDSARKQSERERERECNILRIVCESIVSCPAN